MARKLLAPRTTIWFVPLAGVTAFASPKASEVNAGTNLSAAIEAGYTLGATESDTDDSRTIVDAGNIETPGISNYEASLTFFRDDIGTGTNAVPNPTTIFTTAFNLFKVAGVQGWLVSRQGKLHTEAAAVGDILSLYKVENDHARILDGEKGTPIRVQVPFLPQGEMWLNRTAVA